MSKFVYEPRLEEIESCSTIAAWDHFGICDTKKEALSYQQEVIDFAKENNFFDSDNTFAFCVVKYKETSDGLSMVFIDDVIEDIRKEYNL